MKMNTKLVVCTLITLISSIPAQEEKDPDVENLKASGAHYLQNVMDKLQHERDEGQSVEIMELTNILNMDRVSESAPDHTGPPAVRSPFGGVNVISGPTPHPPQVLSAEVRPLSPPPPALTAGELEAIYKAALAKGASLPQIQAGAPVNQYVPTQIPATATANNHVVQPATHGVAGENFPGYYYYYYPIKSFLQNHQSQEHHPLATAPGGLTPPPLAPPRPINANLMDQSTNKGMEPLFMAVTGFMGMAIMFIMTVLFLPKLGNIRSGDLPELKEAPDELAVFGKLVVESMDGKDCTERIACEVGRIVRRMKLEKPFKVLEIVLPPNMARQIGMIRKAASKKEKCNFIPCRFKFSRPPAKGSENKEPWKKGPSPHDLWMKHFEKEKLALKGHKKDKSF